MANVPDPPGVGDGANDEIEPIAMQQGKPKPGSHSDPISSFQLGSSPGIVSGIHIASAISRLRYRIAPVATTTRIRTTQLTGQYLSVHSNQTT
jgi:hypothetical protein